MTAYTKEELIAIRRAAYPEARRAQLNDVLAKIYAGEVADVDYNIMGDLVDEGMAVKNKFRAGDGCDWNWNGPVAIRFDGEVVEPGKVTPEFLWA